MSADPIRILDLFAPPPGWSETTDLDRDPVAAAILDRVLAEPATNVISLDAARRRRRIVGGVITVIALAAGGAVAALLNRSPSETRHIACWSEPVAPPAERTQVRWDAVSDPAALCTEQWSAGVFGARRSPEDMQVCVTADGSAAVVPGPTTACAKLGFAPYSAPANPATAVGLARDEFNRRFNSTTCRSVAEANEEAKEVLRLFGLGDWDPEIAVASSVDETCATVFLVPERMIAVIRPVAREP